MSTQEAHPRQLVTFQVADYSFGLNVLDVQEVLTHQQMTHVPLAPSEVRGLINLRGQIVTAIDMRKRLGLPELSDPGLEMNVIVQLGDGSVSVIVDNVGDVIAVEPGQFEPPPSTLKSPIKDIILGVYKLNDKLLLQLNPERACEVQGAI